MVDVKDTRLGKDFRDTREDRAAGAVFVTGAVFFLEFSVMGCSSGLHRGRRRRPGG
jgi:hypothetical protein